MKSKAVSGIMLTLLLVGMLALAFNVQQAESLEPPETEWTRTYGGAGWDEAHSVVETGGGGYVIAGYTTSFGVGGGDAWLVKVDSYGNTQWNKTYGGNKLDYAYSVVETSGGGYALAGYTESFGAGGHDFWLVKVDSSGSLQWNKTYGGNLNEAVFSFVKTVDGGYALAGYTCSFGKYPGDFWLVKTDSSGKMEWNKTYGGARREGAYSVVETSGGGIRFGWFHTNFRSERD